MKRKLKDVSVGETVNVDGNETKVLHQFEDKTEVEITNTEHPEIPIYGYIPHNKEVDS